MQLKKLLFSMLILGTFAVHSQNLYQVKSCKIDFSFSNGFQRGTKTLIFSDSGKLEKELVVNYIDTSANSEIPKQFIGSRVIYNSLIIQTKDSIFTADLDNVTGNKRARNKLDMSFFKNGEEKKIGEDTLLSKNCEIIEFQGFKIWYWKGVALKKEINFSTDQTIYEYATSIDENYVIKEDEFKLPKGVKIK